MKLSEREFTVAERYATGETHKEIAAKLHIAPATVRNHLAAIYRKLEVKNKPELIQALPAQEGNGTALPSPEAHAPTIPLLRHLDEDGRPSIDGASIAVMPFANIGPTEAEYFGHGVVAGSGMLRGTSRAARVSKGVIRLGRMCRPMMRLSLQPMARAASTKVCSRIANTTPRVTRQ